MKKRIAALLIACTCFAAVSCGGETSGAIDTDEALAGFFGGYGTVADEGKTDPVYTDDVIVSKLNTTDEGKTYLEVEGKPFLYLGASIRADAFMNCDLYTYEDIERLFAQAAALGVTCVQIPVEWKDIEPEKEQWDFSYLHSILTFLNRYSLKGELLWFGSNMCGDTHSYSVPEYILKDGKTYPRFDAKRTGEFWNYYGMMWYLDFDDPDLMEREGNAAKRMMDYVWEWDSEHGGKKPVIGVQINNEADIFARFRIGTYDVIDPATGAVMTETAAFQKTCVSLDAIGKAVKSAKYKVYTRANLADSTSGSVYQGGAYGRQNVKEMPSFARDFLSLDGIDAVGDDSYKSSVNVIKGIAYMYGGKTQGNFSHFAENAGNYSSTPSLILAAASAGAGYSVYDLATSPFYIANTATGAVDQGIIAVGADRKTFTYSSHYALTKKVIHGLKYIASAAATATTDDFAVFNTSDVPSASVVGQTVDTSDVRFTFSTQSGAMGCAVIKDGKIYAFATSAAKLKIEGVTIKSASDGSESVSLSNGEMILEENRAYILEYEGSGGYTPTVWENIG